MDLASIQSAPKAGPFTKMLMAVAGVDEEALAMCPPHDWSCVRAVGGLLILSGVYQAGLFDIIAHKLFASPGQFRPELDLMAAFIALFIMCIDSFNVMRTSWHLSGIAELKRGGLDISGGPMAHVKASFFLVVRILLSVGLAQLTAIFLSILIFGADVNARIESVYLQTNAPLVANATTLVDAEIQRATEAVTTQDARVAALSAQVTALRENQIDPSSNDPQTQWAQQEVTQLLAEKAKADEEVQRADAFASDELAGIKGAPGNSGQVGNGPRRKAAMEEVTNAKNHAQEVANALDAARGRLDALRKQLAAANDATKQRSDVRLPNFEKAFAAENARLLALKDQLASLTRGRDDAIRDAVEHAPNHVALNDGLLAQITALEHIAQDDSKIAAVIILIDLTSFGFELAAVLAKVTSYVPTTYSALLARDAYLQVLRIVDGMMLEIDRGSKNAAKEPGPTSGSDPFGSPDDPPPTPPKRPRGRPRKYPRKDAPINAGRRGTQEEQPGQLPPA